MDNLMRKLPIGIQTFEGIRKDNYLYVDKTALVWRMANLGKPYFLSRPRRFGKSLLISTFDAYFQGKKSYSMVWLLNNWRRNGNNILFYILI